MDSMSSREYGSTILDMFPNQQYFMHTGIEMIDECLNMMSQAVILIARLSETTCAEALLLTPLEAITLPDETPPDCCLPEKPAASPLPPFCVP